MTQNPYALRDEIALRRASIDDARSEFEAGELSLEEFQRLEAREREAIERCEKELASAHEVVAKARTSRRRKKRYLYVALSAFAVAIVVTLVSSLSTRQPGNSITGGIHLSKSQTIERLLTQAEDDVAANNDAAALSAYESVLSLQPKNIEALTQSGWLDFSAGSTEKNFSVVKEGEDLVRQAVELAPQDPAPHLYYGIIALTTAGNSIEAKKQLSIFLSLKPSEALLTTAKPWLEAAGLSAN